MTLLESGGADAVTTRAIAERAEVPVATVYQFFPNRDAILHEIVLDHLDRRDAEVARLLQRLTPATLSDLIHGIVEFHYAHLHRHPHLVRLHYTSLARGLLDDPRVRRAQFARELHAAALDWGLLRPDTDPLVTTVAVEMGDRTLELAYHEGPPRDRAVLSEGERAVTRYLEFYAAD